MHVILYWE